MILPFGIITITPFGHIVNTTIWFYGNIFLKGVDDMKYNERIRDLREDKDLTQTEVAEVLNTSQTVYSRYEIGIRALPIEHLIKLCKFYNVSADYILGFTNNPKAK